MVNLSFLVFSFVYSIRINCFVLPLSSFYPWKWVLQFMKTVLFEDLSLSDVERNASVDDWEAKDVTISFTCLWNLFLIDSPLWKHILAERISDPFDESQYAQHTKSHQMSKFVSVESVAQELIGCLYYLFIMKSLARPIGRVKLFWGRHVRSAPRGRSKRFLEGGDRGSRCGNTVLMLFSQILGVRPMRQGHSCLVTDRCPVNIRSPSLG